MAGIRNITITRYGTEDVFEKLYKGSAFTWEGLKFDEDEPQYVVEALELMGMVADGVQDIAFYVTDGKTMNEHYGLTGTNRYPDDLTIVSIPLDYLDVGRAIIGKLRLGARWFDDIVENNRMREEAR